MPSVMSKKKHHRLPQFKMKQSSPFVPVNKKGRISQWEEHFQLIRSKAFPLLRSSTLTDSKWASLDLSIRDGRGIEHAESKKRLLAFRTAIRNRFGTRASILANKYGVYCTIHPSDKGLYILRVAKIEFTEAEVVKMFRNGGRGKGHLQQVLSVRTFCK